jgi:hypothetical protein
MQGLCRSLSAQKNRAGVTARSARHKGRDTATAFFQHPARFLATTEGRVLTGGKGNGARLMTDTEQVRGQIAIGEILIYEPFYLPVRQTGKHGDLLRSFDISLKISLLSGKKKGIATAWVARLYHHVGVIQRSDIARVVDMVQYLR